MFNSSTDNDNVMALRQRRGAILDEARALMNKPKVSVADTKAFDALMAESDTIKGQLDRIEQTDALDAELSQPIRRNAGRDGFGFGGDARDPDNNWRNGKTLEPIEVLGKGDKLARRFAGSMAPQVSLGDTVRAMLSPSSVGPDIRAALAEGIGSAGGYTVPEALSAQVIDKMRAQAVCFRAGARLVPMPTQELHIARLDGDPQASWRGEGQTVNESSPAFGRVTLTARSLATVIKISRELVEDSANLDSTLRNALAQSFAVELDRACLFGSGASNEPLGVVGWSGVSEIVLAADGAKLSGYDDFLTALYQLQNANAPDPTAAVLSPRTQLTINRLKDGQGLPLRRPDAIANLPFLTTTSVPDNQTQGQSSDCSSIVMGDFGQMLVGIRTSLVIEVLRERFSDSLQFGLLAFLRADVAIAQPAAFAVIKGIRP